MAARDHYRGRILPKAHGARPLPPPRRRLLLLPFLLGHGPHLLLLLALQGPMFFLKLPLPFFLALMITAVFSGARCCRRKVAVTFRILARASRRPKQGGKEGENEKKNGKQQEGGSNEQRKGYM